MARYIDADKFLKDETKRCGYIPIIGGCTTDNESLAYRLANAPTADMVEVRHGRWTLHKDGSGICSECKKLKRMFGIIIVGRTTADIAVREWMVMRSENVRRLHILSHLRTMG